MGLLRAFLPSSLQQSPSLDAGSPEAGSALPALDGGLGNGGLMDLIRGGLADAGRLSNTLGLSRPGETPGGVQGIIDQKYANNKHMNSPGPWEMAHAEALGDRRRLDPDNQNEDLAAAEHYLWGRASADQTARSVGGRLGHLAAIGDGLATGILALGYEGYKTAGYALKDHNMALGGAMAATGVGLLPGLAMMALGDDVGEAMLRGVSADNKLPSRPSLKSLGWGLKGSGDAIADHWGKLWE